MSWFVNVDEKGYHLTSDGIFSISLIVIILLMILFFNKNKKENSCGKWNAKKLAFCAISISFATVTSFISLFTLPFGGSVTMFSMLFICLTGYFYGHRVGIISGLAFGLMNLIFKPYIVHPIQLILDYILAFSALGISGFFVNSKNGLVKGYLAGVLGRYLFSILSGWIFFGEYAWEGYASLPYSIVYNGAYLSIEAVLTILVIRIPIVYKGINRIKEMALQ